MSQTKELIELAATYQSKGICDLVGSSSEGRTFLQLLTERSDKVLQTTFDASTFRCLREREETAIKVIKNNRNYFSNEHSFDDSARIRDVMAKKTIAFFLARGNLLAALNLLFTCRARYIKEVWHWFALLKIAASALVGLIAVQSSADLQRILITLTTNIGQWQILSFSFLIVITYFALFGLRNERPRIGLAKSIKRSLYPSMMLALYAAFFSITLIHNVGEDLQGFYQSLTTSVISMGVVNAATIAGTMLVGIFMQLFWDKDSATTPL